MTTAISLITWFIWVYSLFVIVHILLSWVQLPYNYWLGRLRGLLFDTVDPYLRIFRRAIPPIGAFDLSPIVALIVLNMVGRIIVGILSGFG